MEKLITTNSFIQTQKLGADFVQKQNEIQVLALHGDLGSGKTTFVQGLAKALGIKKRIISPTFIIMRTYKLKPQKYRQKKFFYHIDLYRIENKSDLEGLGLQEIIANPENIIAMEWPEKISDLLPKKTTHLYFEYQNENERTIKIKSYA